MRWFVVPETAVAKAQAMGAVYDPDVGLWGAADPVQVAQLEDHFAPRSGPLVGLVGEQRDFGPDAVTFGLRLPRWWDTAATQLVPEDAERLAQLVLRRAAQHCEGCGKATLPGGLGLHEHWTVHAERQVQRLHCFAAVCSACQAVLQGSQGPSDPPTASACAHWQAVHGGTAAQAAQAWLAAQRAHALAQGKPWLIDVSIVLDTGLRLQRRAAA